MVWQLAVAFPLFSLFIERVLELIDAIVVLTLFPWWRSPPSPPPAMLLRKPSKEAWDKATEGGIGQETFDKVIYAVGSNKLELTINTYEEAEFYYRRAERLHQQRLMYYIAKYGYFLPTSERGFQRWLMNLVLKMETRLAHREGVPQFPDMGEFASQIVYASGRTSIADLLAVGEHKESEGEPTDISQSSHDLTQQLELWADYCYLRNRRTYEAFALLKRRVYLVFGSLLGMWIVYLAYQIVPSNPGMSLGNPGDENSGSLPDIGGVWHLLGGLGGALSTLAHGIVSFILKRTTPPVEASLIDGVGEMHGGVIIQP